MITQFSLKDFKSFKSATLPLSSLTLLLGPNASGKSNALEGIRLLSWLARGNRLEDIFREVREQDLRVRGSPSDLFRGEARLFQLGCASVHADQRLALECWPGIVDGQLRIRHEELWESGDALALYEVVEGAAGNSHDVQVQYNNFARGGKKPRITCTDMQAIFTQLQSPAVFASHHQHSKSRIPRATTRLKADLDRILFLDPEPKKMRSYSFLADDRLAADGANVSSVLNHLCEAGLKDEILGFVRALPEQDLLDISFLRGPRAEVMVRLTETFGGRQEPRDAPLLSDGTLRVLAIAAALLSAAEGSLVVIEEIDNGIHPTRAAALLMHMLEVAERRALRVLITSHNPALADALPLTTIKDTVYCFRDPADGTSRLVRLSDLPRYPELLAQGDLGQLLSRGLLERFAKDQRSDPDRTAEAMSWLAGLERELA